MASYEFYMHFVKSACEFAQRHRMNRQINIEIYIKIVNHAVRYVPIRSLCVFKLIYAI